MTRYHIVRGERWHLVLAPRAAGGALYLSRADAVRGYRAAERADAGVELADLGALEPATLRARWADAADAHVFRVVTADDLGPLAHYSTADELVYAGGGLAALPSRYLAEPLGHDHEAAHEASP